MDMQHGLAHALGVDTLETARLTLRGHSVLVYRHPGPAVLQ